jgi:hypothetical protein
MSWILDIEKEYKITTGDGKIYTPLWKPSTILASYQIAKFDFPNINGTLVDQKATRGNNYGFEIYFQGEDHLQVSEDFRLSCNDKRPWKLSHPYYGELLVKVGELLFDNTKYNISTITGTLLETISETFPQSNIVPEDQIASDKEENDLITSQAYANNNPTPDSNDINQMNESVTGLEDTTPSIITKDSDAAIFKNRVGVARNDIINATGKPLAAMRSIQSTINFPFEIQQSIKTRLDLLTGQFNTLLNTVLNAPNTVPTTEKRYFESFGSTILGAMAVTSSTSNVSTDYDNQAKVIAVISTLTTNYSLFLGAIDDIQSIDTDELDSYIPDFESMISLNDLMNFTISNLFNIANDSRQQRSIILEEDSDVINVTHRFYGLDADDVNINQFIANNNIGATETLTIRKGRTIIYYV